KARPALAIEKSPDDFIEADGQQHLQIELFIFDAGGFAMHIFRERFERHAVRHAMRNAHRAQELAEYFAIAETAFMAKIDDRCDGNLTAAPGAPRVRQLLR